MSDGRKTREALNTEAARWVVLLAADDCDESTRQRFEVWRNASPSHEVAFEREQLAWERTERLRALRPADAVEETPVRADVPASWFRTALASSRWRVAAMAASLVVAAAIGWLSWIQATTEVYATQVGERRSVWLDDGSRLELNTNTLVTVRMTRGTRHLDLQKGESLFEVAHDQARPFIVAVGDNTVRAVGTAFNIRRDGAAFQVLVTEGVVQARGDKQGPVPAYDVRVAAGSMAAYGTHGLESRSVSAPEQERALAWRSGTIALAGETLAQAAAQFNRYNTKQIVVADPRIAGVQLGGYFNANDLEAFVKVLVTTFGVSAENADNQILLRGTDAATSP